MFTKQAALLPGGSRRSPRNRSRRGLFTAKGMIDERKKKNEKKSHGSLDATSSSETGGSFGGRVRAENLQDYEPSELVHGLISESSSGESSSSSSSEESGAQKSAITAESAETEEEDEIEFEGAYGCMDGFFMPRRAAAAKKSLIALNENGEKELKFNMKLPIAMDFHREQQKAKKEASANKDTSNRDDTTDDERKNIRTLGSMLSCRADNCHANQDLRQATVEGFPVPQIRHQTADPPAKVAGKEPSDQFRSLMSLSHDGSSVDDESHSNIRRDNFVLPPPPLPPPFHMQSSHHAHHSHMMHGPSMHPGAWQQQNMMYPHHPLTVNNTYEMLVVNGMMPQQHLPYGRSHGYWDGQYMGNPTVSASRQMEPPAIEKLPSQIVVQQEDKSIGEDSSYFSYDAVPVPAPGASRMQMDHRVSLMYHQRAQQGYPPPARVLKTSNQYPYGNAQPFPHRQLSNIHDMILMKATTQGVPNQNSYSKHTQHQSKQGNDDSRPKARPDESSHEAESEDDFQDSVQVLSDELVTKSSSTSCNEEKPPRVQRWRQANLRRLKGPSAKQSNKPPLPPVAAATSIELNSKNTPSYDEVLKEKTEEELVVVESSTDSTNASHETDDTDSSNNSSFDSSDDESDDNDNDSDDDDDEEEEEEEEESENDKESDDDTVDSDQAIVEAESVKSKVEGQEKPERALTLQPVQEEEENASFSSSNPDKVVECPKESNQVKNGDASYQEKPKADIHKTLQSNKPAKDQKCKDTNQEPTEGGGFLMFDSIYTRRRERRDASKKKMSDFLDSRELPKAQILDDKSHISGFSRITSALLGPTREHSQKNSNQEIELQDEQSVEENQPPTQTDSMLPTPQQGNKTISPQIETAGSTDAVLQSVLDVPGLNSPANITPRGPSSPSKSVSMAPLPPSESFSETHIIKMSLSLKPTMTSEFHDAMSTTSESLSDSSQDETNCPLQLQATMTNEWHDTIQSPTAYSSVATMYFGTSCPSSESSPEDEPGAIKCQETKDDEDSSSTNNDLTLHKFSTSFDASCEVE